MSSYYLIIIAYIKVIIDRIGIFGGCFRIVFAGLPAHRGKLSISTAASMRVHTPSISALTRRHGVRCLATRCVLLCVSPLIWSSIC